jgi:hypothetical protein
MSLFFFLVINKDRHMGAVPWLRRLVAGLSLLRPGFDPGSVHVGFVGDKVALIQVPPPPPESFGFPL